MVWRFSLKSWNSGLLIVSFCIIPSEAFWIVSSVNHEIFAKANDIMMVFRRHGCEDSDCIYCQGDWINSLAMIAEEGIKVFGILIQQWMLE